VEPAEHALNAMLNGVTRLIEGGTEKSRLLAERYGEVAKREGVAFLNAGAVI
jgi:hypothetical protein